MKSLRRYGFSVVMAAFLDPSLAWADTPASAPSVEAVDHVTSAKELNRKGLVFFDAGDYAHALPFFESSRALVPSHANTRNVALCLDGLGRKAAALRMYETLVHHYGESLDAPERAATEKRIAELKQETFVQIIEAPKAPPAPAPVVSVAPAPGRFSAGVFLGYAVGPSLGSDAETEAALSCDVNCPLANGGVVGGRVGYRVGSGFSLEIAGGYLHLGSAFQRDVASTYGAAQELSVTYRFNQTLRLSGAFAGMGASGRFPLTERWSLVGRMGLALLSANVSNAMNGVAMGTGAPADLSIGQERTAVKTISVLVTPEVTMEATLGRVVFGAGLGAFVSTLPGTDFGVRRLKPANPSLCALSAESSGACAPESTATSGERALGAFVVFVPQISARYAFH